MGFDVQREADGAPVGGVKRRRAKPFRIDMMFRNPANRATGRWNKWADWTRSWHSYATAAQRDRAVEVLNRKDRCFIYRAHG